MYDGLTGRYTFQCPHRGRFRVLLSAFRAVERLPGPAHPSLYQVTYSCVCGEEHEGLLTHDELDWAPIGVSGTVFFNVMTARLELADAELADQAARRIEAGAWPWIFFCYPEERSRPFSPSSFRLLSPAEESVGVAVRCPSCACTSVNLVSRRHVDEPFYSDPHVAVVEHIFASDREQTLDAFREELHSGAFDARRRGLAA